ncbi:MAG: glycosyltransferase family 39 protein [Anaerolineales bacterium]|nr:glycosyltransferase family 39 protein [Anaerolineales bacterium]
MKNSNRYSFLFVFALLCLLWVAFALRIFRLDAQSLWWDEGISLHLATSSLTEIIADRINNIHPPLYFFILKFWLQLTGVNPFSARYLSALASWLQVGLLFAVLRRWFGGRLQESETAWVGGVLLAFSAVAIIYGQETRVYAFLPLVFLALLALTQRILDLETPTTHANWRLYFGLGLVTWIGLHLHYIVAFLIVYVIVWAGIVLLRQRLWRGLERWLVTYVLVGLASLPWFGALLWNWTAVQAEANAGTFATEPVLFDFLIQQIWVFHLTGLAGSLANPLVRWLAAATAILFLLLLLIRLLTQSTRNTTAILLAHWLVSLSLVLLIWSVRSFSHPRYVVMYTIGLVLLAAYLIWPGIGKNYTGAKEPNGKKFAWVLSLLLVVGLLLTSCWGLYHYYFDSGTAKDDIRGAARYLEETEASADSARSGTDDLILLPDTDYALQFEYKGDATVAMPMLDQPDQMWPHLEALTADVGRVFVLDYKRGTRDWQQVVPFVLEAAGTLVDETEIDALIVREYVLDTAVTPPEFTTQQVRFGPLVLTDAWIEQNPPSNSAVTVALRWQLREPVTDQFNLALHLRDDSGWLVSTEDALLLDGNGRPTDQWDGETAVVTYHVLPLKVGLPPANYALDVSVYMADAQAGVQVLDVLDDFDAPQGETMTLGNVTLDNPLPVAEEIRPFIVEPSAEPLTFASDLMLLGWQLETSELLAGQKVWVQLLWQITENANLKPAPTLLLLQGEKLIASTNNQPDFSLVNSQPDTLLAQRRSLRIPADVNGDLTVAVQVGDTIQPLGIITVKETDREFEEPAVSFLSDVEFGGMIRLVGYDLSSSTLKTNQPLSLTLHWEAMDDGSTDFTVFTHLLAADGRLIGQHDSQPANGMRPTSTWLQGEFITDSHTIALQQEDFQGEAQIEVGFYNPQTGDRLLTQDEEDFFLLPEKLFFESE